MYKEDNKSVIGSTGERSVIAFRSFKNSATVRPVGIICDVITPESSARDFEVAIINQTDFSLHITLPDGHLHTAAICEPETNVNTENCGVQVVDARLSKALPTCDVGECDLLAYYAEISACYWPILKWWVYFALTSQTIPAYAAISAQHRRCLI